MSVSGPCAAHKLGKRGSAWNKKRQAHGGKPPPIDKRRIAPRGNAMQAAILSHLWVAYRVCMCSRMLLIMLSLSLLAPDQTMLFTVVS